MMQAIVVHEYGEPEVMQVEEVETPQPADTFVLVKIQAAGVNPVDTYLRTGIHAHAPELPYTQDRSQELMLSSHCATRNISVTFPKM